MLSNNNKNVSLRDILKTLIDDSNIKAILIGEDHSRSPTSSAILANLDLFKNSPRKVVFVIEALSQDINDFLEHAAKEKDPKKLETIKEFDQKELELFNLSRVLISQGIILHGAENTISNPFIHKEKTSQVIDEMRTYQHNLDRIIKPNEVFAQLINSLCAPETVVIFIGGASHTVKLTDKDKEIDSGITGRVNHSVTLFLQRGDDDYFQENFNYLNEEKHLQGNYQYYFETNNQSLYRQSFNAYAKLNDKKSLLVLCLDNLIQAYLAFSHKKTITLKSEFNILISAFKASLEITQDLPELNQLLEAIIQIKENIENKKNSLLAFFNRKFKQSYATEQLEKALDNDLKTLMNQLPTHSKLHE